MRKLVFLLMGLFVIITLSSSLAHAIPVIYINDTLTKRNITTHVDIAKGYQQAFWPWEIEERSWAKETKTPFYLLSTQNIYTEWYRFAIQNRSGDTQRLVLSLGNSFLNTVDLFVVNSRGALERVWYTGVDRGLASKPIPSGNFSFPLTIDNRDAKTIFIKVKSHFNTTPEIKLEEINIYNRFDAIEKVVNGMISGVLLLVCLYSIVMFFFIREWRFIFYALFTLSLTSSLWLTGSYMTVISHLIEDVDIIKLFIIANFTMQLGLLLSISDLIFAKFNKRIALTVGIFGITLIASAISSWFIPVFISLHLVIVTLTIMLLWSFTLLWISLKQSDLVHFGYVCSLISFLVGCTIPFLCLVGILSGDIYTKITFFVVSVSAGMVISIALGYRTYQENVNRVKLTQDARIRTTRYIKMLNFVSEGVFIISMEGEIKYLNPALCSLLAYKNLRDVNDARIYSFQSLCENPRDFEALVSNLLSEIEQANHTQKPKENITASMQLSLKRSIGQSVLVAVSVRLSEDSGGIAIIEGEAIDLSGKENYQNQLDFVANHDEVTGAYNRRYMHTSLTNLFIQKEENGTAIGCDFLCFIHIENFKFINEVTVHCAGDELLKLVVSYLSRNIKDTYEIVRLNSDEFAIIMRDTYIDEALRYVEKWRSGLPLLRFNWKDNVYTITVNLGVVDIYEAHNSVSNLLSYADIACNIARELGPNTIHIYNKANSKFEQYKDELSKTTDILTGIRHNGLYAVRQKIEYIGINTASLGFYEISARIKTDFNKVLNPLATVGDKDIFNLMPVIEEWLITSVVNSYFKEEQIYKGKLAKIFINLSYASICDSLLQNKLFTLLSSTGKATNKLCFLLNERQISEHFGVVEEFMARFSQIGVLFALDNYGTGSRSYKLLAELPFTYIRIGNDFIKDIATNSANQVIVRSITELAKGLHKETIVGHVASDFQIQTLQELGVDMGEGDYFGEEQIVELSNSAKTAGINDSYIYQ